jgi:hypothetical protein
MVGNPDFKHESTIKNCFAMTGLGLTLLGDIGLCACLKIRSRGWMPSSRLWVLVLGSVFLSLLSFVIVFLEYGVLNFGDSDLPPYQPDPLFERAFDFVLCTVGRFSLFGCFRIPIF